MLRANIMMCPASMGNRSTAMPEGLPGWASPPLAPFPRRRSPRFFERLTGADPARRSKNRGGEFQQLAKSGQPFVEGAGQLGLERGDTGVAIEPQPLGHDVGRAEQVG